MLMASDGLSMQLQNNTSLNNIPYPRTIFYWEAVGTDNKLTIFE